MKKQSSVEWLEQQLNAILKQSNIEIENVIWQQAKAMHEMEIITAHFTAQPFNSTMLHNAEQYYNETFKK